jgi:hypothetical protein
MSAALSSVVAAVGGAGGWARAFAVLGDMLEIGPESEELHRALGREAGVRLAGVVSLGNFAAAIADGARAAGLAANRTQIAASPEEAAAVMASWTAPGDWILVKASRGMRLERVVDATRRPAQMLFHLFNRLRETPGRERVPLRVDAHRPGDADVAADHPHRRALVHPPRPRAPARGADPRRRPRPAYQAKQGTPTMGGALIIMALSAGTVLWCDLRSTLVWLALLVTVGYGVIGFVDDYLKLSRKNKKGLPGKVKLLGQFVIGLVAMIWLYTGDALPPESRLRLVLPLVNFHHMSAATIAWTTLPVAAYIGFAVFVLMAIERGQPDRRPRRPGDRAGDHLFLHLPVPAYAAGARRCSFNIAEYLGMAPVPGRASWRCSGRDGRRRHRLPLVQHPPGAGVHGRRRRAGAGRRHRFVALATKTELALPSSAACSGRPGGQRRHPGRLLQEDQEAHLPDGPCPPPFREAGLAGVQNCGAFLDSLVRLRDSRPHHHAEGEMRANTWI